MTEAELEAIEARAKAATEGPWVPKPVKAGYSNGEIEHEVRSAANGMTIAAIRFRPLGDESDPADRDLAFIASARSDVPALVAEVRRLQEALQAQPAAEGHMADIFCPAFHGLPCGCGHSVIATALGRDETPI